MGTADHCEVYRCYLFEAPSEHGNGGVKEGGPFLYVEERVKGPVGGGMPKAEKYQIEGLTEEETQDRPHGSSNMVRKNRVRKYYKKTEERKRIELRGHWHLQAEDDSVHLVWPVEARQQGNLGGLYVNEWKLMKDSAGSITGLVYDGNDCYNLKLAQKPRDWG